MATNYPTSLDSFTNPAATDDVSVVTHDAQHANANDAIKAIEVKVGVDGSSVTTSIDYLIRQINAAITNLNSLLNAAQNAALLAADDGDDDAGPLPGPMGPRGAAGAAGPTGAKGASGPQGPPGPAVFGIDGDDGDDSLIPGPPGSKGAKGAKGDKGDKGDPGTGGGSGGSPGMDGEDGEDSIAPAGWFGGPLPINRGGTGVHAFNNPVPSAPHLVAVGGNPQTLSAANDGAIDYGLGGSLAITGDLSVNQNILCSILGATSVVITAWPLFSTNAATKGYVDAKLASLPFGLQGEDGEDSFIPGPRGLKGAAGAAGATGATGPTGATGATGAAGADGRAGTPGMDGEDANEWSVPQTVNAYSVPYSALRKTGSEGLLGNASSGTKPIVLVSAANVMGLLSGAASADFSINSHKITNLSTPSSSSDAATKSYVDVSVAPLSPKTDCAAATVAALAANTYSNGTAGVGATITMTVAAVLVIDGYTPSLNDRLLIKNEGTAAHNGIYSLTTVGTLSVAAVLTRTTDFDHFAIGISGAKVFISNGTVNASTMWVCTADLAGTVGTTSINWFEFAGSSYTADESTLHLSGVQFSIISTYAGQTSITTLGTIGTGVWQGTAIASAYLSVPLIVLQDQKAKGTNGGTFTSGADQTRVLNTIVTDTGSICTLASNAFTIPAGTYEFECFAPALNVNQNQAWLYNTSDSAVVLVGQSCYAPTSSLSSSVCVIRGTFTITGAKTFTVQHRCQTTGTTNGFGATNGWATPNLEVYTTVMLRKIA